MMHQCVNTSEVVPVEMNYHPAVLVSCLFPFEVEGSSSVFGGQVATCLQQVHDVCRLHMCGYLFHGVGAQGEHRGVGGAGLTGM